MAVVAPDKLDAFMAIVDKWDVETSVLGEVTDTGRLVINWRGVEIVNVDPRTVAIDGPVYDRPVAYPAWIDALQADTASALPRPQSGEELREQVLALVSSANLADPEWITQQYDRYVLGNTALAEAVDKASDEVKTGGGLAFALGQSKRFPKLATQMISVGEESGELDNMLLKVADTFDVEVRNTLERLLAALVPATTVIMTVVVAIIMMAIILPILKLTSSIQ
jgi:phosphoribosylformylglycinamidine (FGAM) synthase-like enzyme